MDGDPREQAPAAAGGPARRRGGPSGLALGCAAVLMLAAVVAAWLGWRSAVRAGVAGDLTAYAEFTRGSEGLDAARRDELIEALSGLDERNRACGIRFREWMRVARVGDPVVEDGRVQPEEADRLLQALRRLLRHDP